MIFIWPCYPLCLSGNARRRWCPCSGTCLGPGPRCSVSCQSGGTCWKDCWLLMHSVSKPRTTRTPSRNVRRTSSRLRSVLMADSFVTKAGSPACPISVDFQVINERAQSPEVARRAATARRRFAPRPGMRLGLGVDRLDYTKGLLKRLWALDLFFTNFPQYRGAFTFVQVAIPTRTEIETYRQYRDLITQTVAEINGRHGGEGWQPIEYHEGRIPLDTLLAYYRMADLALVSSVYDGMNLVAKEYVASRVDETGMLLISQMTGSAEELTDAVIINPYDLDGVADAIRQALEMPVEEQLRRMRALRAHVRAQDVHAWVNQCLQNMGLPAASVHACDDG